MTQTIDIAAFSSCISDCHTKSITCNNATGGVTMSLSFTFLAMEIQLPCSTKKHVFGRRRTVHGFVFTITVVQIVEYF